MSAVAAIILDTTATLALVAVVVVVLVELAGRCVPVGDEGVTLVRAGTLPKRHRVSAGIASARSRGPTPLCAVRPATTTLAAGALAPNRVTIYVYH